jgi:uncharacterized OB-fold protein
MIAPRPLFEAPRSAPWLTPYWEGLARRELRLPQCSVCGRWEWYPLESGPGCPGGRYVWRALGPDATVFTFTRVARPLLPGVSEPYITGLVVADDAPDVRIAARLAGDPDVIRIGARARLAFSGEGEDTFPYFIVEDRT